MPKTLAQIMTKFTNEEQAEIQVLADQFIVEEIALKNLSKKLGFSEAELEQYLAIHQGKISQFEQQQNSELRILRALVNELGGTMEIIVKIPNKQPTLLRD